MSIYQFLAETTEAFKPARTQGSRDTADRKFWIEWNDASGQIGFYGTKGHDI